MKEKFFGFGREELKKQAPRQVRHPKEQLKLHGERWHLEAKAEKGELKSNSVSSSTSSKLGTQAEIRYYEASKEELQMEKELRKVSSSEANWEQLKETYQDTVEITIVERTYKKVIHRQAKYKLKGAQKELTRSGKVAEELVEGYQGAILTDGFPGYNRFKKSEGIRIGNCWSHCRREYYERAPSFPKETEKILSLIDQLFAVEAKAKSFDELRQLKRTESKKITDEIYRWLFSTKVLFLPSQGISAAIDYTLKRWKELTLFLQDLSLPLSNNDCERALRHIVMGRKNFNGSRTINGAGTAATLYTVIESAKKVGLEPKEYLKYVIDWTLAQKRTKVPSPSLGRTIRQKRSGDLPFQIRLQNLN